MKKKLTQKEILIKWGLEISKFIPDLETGTYYHVEHIKLPPSPKPLTSEQHHVLDQIYFPNYVDLVKYLPH